MIISIPCEIKSNENRVSLTPQAAETIRQEGHKILVEKNAGKASGFSNEDYELAGAEVVEGHDTVFNADLIIKVKEILPPEYSILREGKIIMTYLHLTEGRLGSKKSLANALLTSKIVAFSYDTIQLENGYTPLLAPMSEIAGHNGF